MPFRCRWCGRETAILEEGGLCPACFVQAMQNITSKKVREPTDIKKLEEEVARLQKLQKKLERKGE
jgi:NMD protein affecting ribosome stability and mRNA decay